MPILSYLDGEQRKLIGNWTLNIPIGASLTNTVGLSGMTLKRIICPANVDGDYLGIELSYDGIEYGLAVDDGGDIMFFPMRPSTSIEFHPDLFSAMFLVRLRTFSNILGTERLQTASPTFTMISV